MSYEKIDPLDIEVFPLAGRESSLSIEDIALDPLAKPAAVEDARLAGQISALRDRVIDARQRGASVMLTYGAHLIKNGGGPLVRWLVEAGWVTHVATQGAGIIHDWEFASLGCSSESVRDNAAVGKFGSWDETGRAINLAALAGGAAGLGLGESIGKFIAEDGLTLPSAETLAEQIRSQPGHPLTAGRADLLAAMETFSLAGGEIRVAHPYEKYSVPAGCYKAGVPMTVHPGIGYDIYVNHPMFSGSAIGRAAGVDARVITRSTEGLTGGVYLSVGCAIMSPQVFEKAFSLANNLRRQRGEEFLRDHYIGIVDIQPGGDWDWTAGEPPKNHPAYYLRFCKSFYRMGGQVDYLCSDNRLVLANLIQLLRKEA